MGQAKTRKLNNPDYGKPSKMRGLIISNPLEISGSAIVKSEPIDIQDLRSSLMYWDRLALPQNNLIGFGDCADINFLESAGILYKHKFVAYGRTTVEDLLVNIQLTTLLAYEKEQKGIWSISSGKNSIISEKIPRKNEILIQLLNAVPVPNANVPLSEILEFKTKRRDELLFFREHFEILSEKIMKSSDSISELEKTLKEVDSACNNLLKTTREWQYPVKIASIHASINFDIAKAASAAAAVYHLLNKAPFGLSTTTSSLAAAGASLISQCKVGMDFGFRGIKRGTSPYKYAYLAQRDLF